MNTQLASWQVSLSHMIEARREKPDADVSIRNLLNALETDNFTCLVQGSTTVPPPLLCVKDWPCEGGCAVSWLASPRPITKMDGPTVGEVEQGFAELCAGCDKHAGVHAACRFFNNWFDDTPWKLVRVQLAAELRFHLGEGPQQFFAA